MKRIRILYVILAVLLLASVGPLLFYALKTMDINRRALETNEVLLQNSITRSVAEEISIYNETFHQLLETLDHLLTQQPGLSGAGQGFQSEELRKTLEGMISSSRHISYITVLDAQGRGIQAGNYSADSDPFLVRTLNRAFAAAQQRSEFQSDPVLISQSQQLFPAMLIARPIIREDQFDGMMAVVLNLQSLVERLKSSSTNGLEAFVVDRSGRLVLTPNLQDHSLGQSMIGSPIVNMFLSWKGNVKGAETSEFDLTVGDQKIPMVGTYSPVQSLGWAVIAQKKRTDAYHAVDEMVRATTNWGLIALATCLALSYLLTLGIERPIRGLTEATRAIAQGDFSRRISLKSRTEIGELASTFNHMSADLELYVQQLKDAAETNRQLFLDSIRMIAAAVDEKDPYTHGHSERVSRYSVLIARQLGLSEEEVDRIRISALLHDIGKIGIEDKILKKPGMLTPEEFAIMKQHPQKGAAIASRVAQLREMVPGIELHHEWLDGRGYPYGLQGADIPLMACIISVADTFDAMTTHRPYQTAMDPGVAIDYIQSFAGKKYEPRVAAALGAVFQAGEIKVARAATLV
ncbi:MAG TPA: HD domain-containing phosphohydrolase [Terriglobia bacterium]|nr:HD domain-containing phosphohydrolase [Terriglobia bacterium]